MHHIRFKIFYLSFIGSLISCHYAYHITQRSFDQTTVNNVQNNDSVVLRMIAPYHDSLHNKMSEVIGYSKVIFKKEQPEGSLGNFVCDILMEHYAYLKPDLCVVNYGGLRVPQITEGNITVGKIFELMPFDNTMVIQYIQGKDLKKLFEKIAQKKGWPVSEGVSLEIENGMLNDAHLFGNEIIANKTYKLLTSDYLANGGDECTFLKAIPTEKTNEVFRDVLIQEIKRKTLNGEKLAASVSGRITEIKK